ncbi:MAG: hypothetical protein AAFV07_14405, partial [Bacteroidota bacterium]
MSGPGAALYFQETNFFFFKQVFQQTFVVSGNFGLIGWVDAGKYAGETIIYESVLITDKEIRVVGWFVVQGWR